jgi:hypothetical protein
MNAPANAGLQCHPCVANVVRNPPTATIVAAVHLLVGAHDLRSVMYAASTAALSEDLLVYGAEPRL